MAEKHEASIAMLAQAIQQAGPYTAGQRAEVHFVGKFHSYDDEYIHKRDRDFMVTLSAKETEQWLKEVSFDSIIDNYGLSHEDIEEVEAYRITVRYHYVK